MRTAIRASSLILLVALLGAISCRDRLSIDSRSQFREVAGVHVTVIDSVDLDPAFDAYRLADLTLASDTGLQVRLRVRSPESVSSPRPAVLLLGGYKTGRRAADLPVETGNLVVAAAEYPYTGSLPRGREWIGQTLHVRSSALETPSTLLLAARYLRQREDVDPDRVIVIGASLGVPFAVAATAVDPEIAGLALLHGGGDLRRMVSHFFQDRIPSILLGPLALGVGWAMASLEPIEYIGEIAPRPVLMINATEDELIPSESAFDLYRSAGEPKRMEWTESAHVGLSESDLLAELMGRVLTWMDEQGLR